LTYTGSEIDPQSNLGVFFGVISVSSVLILVLFGAFCCLLKRKKARLFLVSDLRFLMEPMRGLEPLTYALRVRIKNAFDLLFK